MYVIQAFVPARGLVPRRARAGDLRERRRDADFRRDFERRLPASPELAAAALARWAGVAMIRPVGKKLKVPIFHFLTVTH